MHKFMKGFLTIALLIIASKIFSQEISFRPTYTFEGFIETSDQRLDIELNFLILLDSTIVGSYFYKPRNGSLKLAGHLNSDNTFWLTERDSKDSVTGFFSGLLSEDKEFASGEWRRNKTTTPYKFSLLKSVKISYWNYIKKHRALFEYKSIENAILEKEKVLSVDVANQRLSKLPKQLSVLEKIVSINLLGNEFTSFPEVLTQLNSLEEISLSSNRLTKVSSKIGALKNLRILILNFNSIQELPKEISELKNLLYLELGRNKLTRLPDEIKFLVNLQELHLEGNPFSDEEKLRTKKLLPNCIVHF